MSDFLFSCGVIDDDDRTPRERASTKAPVRCLEEELLPKVADTRQRCQRCKVSPRHDHHVVCTLCLQETTDQHRKERDRVSSSRGKLIAKMLADGYAVVHRQDHKAARMLIDASEARWATARDLRRLGLSVDVYCLLPTSRIE